MDVAEGMQSPAGGAQVNGTGLACLAIVGCFHSVPEDPGRLRHEFAK